ncbi:MAG: transport integral membrane protein [Bryobacteraceae bacterium]|nr:MAG: transport integral membrane protein [Bryobacteraceae bacterium]
MDFSSRAAALVRFLKKNREAPLAILIGVVTSLVIAAFIWTTELVGARLYTAESPAWMRLIFPAAGALFSGLLLYRYFPDARGSGIPQTKAALFTGRTVSLRTAIGKFVCCSVSLGSGISLGREGPSVQIGAGIVSGIGRRVGLKEREASTLIPMGAAAALAAAFNTPIAGVLFTLEEILGDMHARIFGGVVLASASSWLVLHLLLGDEPLFHVPAYRLGSPVELLVYVLLGLAGGLVSALFQWLLVKLRERFLALPKRTLPWQPVAGGLFVGLLAWWIPGLLGVGYGAVGQALNGSMAWHVMLLLLLLKLPATALCYASGNPGGIFGPSLFLGAMLGGSIGSLSHSLFPEMTGPPGAYALVGMGTTFAGIIRTPMTSVLMIFELTRDYSIIVPLMISNLLSFWLARRLIRTPIYEQLAAQDGVHLPKPPDERTEHELMVRDAMRPVSLLLDPDTEVGEAALYPGRHFLVGRDGVLWGIVSSEELFHAPGHAHLAELLPLLPEAMPSPPSALLPHMHPDHPLDLALHRFGATGLTVLPVTDRMNSRLLLGELTLQDLLDAYRRSAAQ